MDPGWHSTSEWAFRNYEGKVRNVLVETRKVIIEASDAGMLAVPDLQGQPRPVLIDIALSSTHCDLLRLAAYLAA